MDNGANEEKKMRVWEKWRYDEQRKSKKKQKQSDKRCFTGAGDNLAWDWNRRTPCIYGCRENPWFEPIGNRLGYAGRQCRNNI